MTNQRPTHGSKEDWRAVLQEAHRYVVHYSTVRLSLVTFLVTASLTALGLSLPKETVSLTVDSATVYQGTFSLLVFLFSVLFFGSAALLNYEFDRRRYVIERFARDVEVILDAHITGAHTTENEHSLDELSEGAINTIILHKNDNLDRLHKYYLRDCIVYNPFRGPRLNRFITVLFIAYLMLLVGSFWWGCKNQKQFYSVENSSSVTASMEATFTISG